MHSQRQLAGASSTRYVNPPATNIFGILNPSYSVFPPSSATNKQLLQLPPKLLAAQTEGLGPTS